MASKIFRDCGSSNFKLGLCSGFGSRDVLEEKANGEGGLRATSVAWLQ